MSDDQHILLNTIDTIHLVNLDDILYCKSDNSDTTFYLKNNQQILVSKSLQQYESLLTHHGFFRAHQSYLVNLNHVRTIDKSDGCYIIMNNKREIPISSRQIKQLRTLLNVV